LKSEKRRILPQTIPPFEEASIHVLGARVHYLHAGSGRPMLLIHGLVGSSANWRRNIEVLSRSASVYAIDLVNMGRSQRISGLDASLEATADQVAATMDALGLDQADIAGHSHGGAVSLMLAARHPQRVRSLILFAPANPFSYLGDFLVRVYTTPVGRLAARLGPYLPRRIHAIALARMYGDPARIAEDTLPTYIGALRIRGTVPHILSIVRRWFADMAKLKAALPRVASIPTLLVWGDRDRAVDPASAVPLQRILRNSELYIVPGGGHVLFDEMPEEANRLMLNWLSRDSSASAASIADQDTPTARRRVGPPAGRHPIQPATIGSTPRSSLQVTK
jgi:pimeloyl-ACP methyl ester carboxylesterase